MQKNAIGCSLMATPPGLSCRHKAFTKILLVIKWCRKAASHQHTNRQIMLAMKLTACLLTTIFLSVHAIGVSQTVTISGKHIPLEKVFSIIEKQTGFFVFYNKHDLNGIKPVAISAQHMPLNDFLNSALKDQPLAFRIDGRDIILSRKAATAVPGTLPAAQVKPPVQRISLSGIIRNMNGEALKGVSIRVKGAFAGIATDAQGAFLLSDLPENAVLHISCVGYDPVDVGIRKIAYGYTVFMLNKKLSGLLETTAGEQPFIQLKMQEATSPLDEVQVIAYGSTSKRYNTGSVTTVKAVDIEKQPVSNPLQVLGGLVPGMSISQNDGLPGGWFDVVIRGRNSLAQGYRPLVLIDGVPYTNESTAGSFPGTNLYNSALNIINPGDIESIEVLKDADATAIYGSRGSNGVIMITTKKGKAGKSGFNVNAYTGITKATIQTRMMNTQQYLEMRREAFRNDGITPTIINAPDLLIWDTTRYTDWNREYRENNATTSNIQMDYSGGNQYTQFRLGASYHYETPLYGKIAKKVSGNDMRYYKSSVQFSFSHRSTDDKLKLSLTTGYNWDKSNFTGAVGRITLAPHAPDPIDENGKLVWQAGGVNYANPIAGLQTIYDAGNKVLMSSGNISYTILTGLELKVSGGYNTTAYNDIRSTPKSASNPAYNPTSFSYFYDNNVSSWQVEPMLQYSTRIGKGSLDILAGESWNSKSNNGIRRTAYNYSSEVFLGTMTNAARLEATNTDALYKYHGIYGRVNYNLDGKYIINFTGRRDGSSRFGPGKRYSNFGAAGVAWIFSEEAFVQKTVPFLSFGKIRANYGVTGNDNVGNYMFYETWASPSSSYSYDGIGGLVPMRLFNADYSWEKNLKLEVALDLGFFNDRLLLTANYYRSRAGNQLVDYALPGQTGFTSILKNFEAVVQNYGWEWTMSAVPVKRKFLRWNIDFNATLARNKLLSFPGLESSSYSSRFIIGETVSGLKYYPFLGVDPETGLYAYEGTTAADKTIMRDYMTPDFYGGITNGFTYKGFSLDIFCQFVKQERAAAVTRTGTLPGSMVNQPVELLDRWQNKGDDARYQRFTTGLDAAAAAAYNKLNGSLAFLEDASFIRLKNLSISYSLNEQWLKHSAIKTLRVYFQGQNLAVLTRYRGADPESAGYGNPLLKVFTGGIQLSL